METMETPLVPFNTGLNDLVYEPAEDSFLLLDALEIDLRNIFQEEPSDDILFTLEVGCGSGLISTALAKCNVILNGRTPCVFAADINRRACLLTEKTGRTNNVCSNLLHTILLDGQLFKLNPFKIQFDLIVCNPPYVPIPFEENVKDDDPRNVLQKSWNGGPDGNRFIIPFLKNVGQLLKDGGTLYLLLSSWNKPEMLVESVALPNGLRGTEIIKRPAGRERLSVWKFNKILS